MIIMFRKKDSSQAFRVQVLPRCKITNRLSSTEKLWDFKGAVDRKLRLYSHLPFGGFSGGSRQERWEVCQKTGYHQLSKKDPNGLH